MSAVSYIRDLGAELGIDSEAMRWMDLARCAEVDSEIFFPEKGESSREAKRVCRDCEVKPACLAYALERNIQFGVWGGLSRYQRDRLRAEPGTVEAAA